MWNSYWSNRSRRDVPRPNYNESSEEDDYESPLVSPSRPPPTRAASPVELAVPTLADNVDEELEAVSQTLRNVGHSHTFRNTRPDIPDRPEPEGGDALDEEVVEGHIVGESDPQVCALNRSGASLPDIMAEDEVEFEDENGQDDPGALKEACRNAASVEWDDTDIRFFFNQVEIKMQAVGVKKNFTKLQVLSTVIPKRVQDEVKELLSMKASEFPNNDGYKQLKHEILRIFGPRPEDAVDRALARVLTGKPSQLARALVGDICKRRLDCPCCPAVVMSLWKRQLPSNVKSHIAGMKFDKSTMKDVLQHADDVFSSNQPSSSVAAVRLAAAAAPPPASLDETQPAIPYPAPEVAAASRGGGGNRGGRGGRGGYRGSRGGGNRGGGNSGQGGQSGQDGQARRHRGPKHPDLPPGEWKGCGLHYKWGKGAHFCAEPATCPWKNVFTPRPSK